MGVVARILVVDDEPHMRTMVTTTLVRFGYEAMAAAGRQEARELLDRHQFDLVLTDMVLHDGTGLNLLDGLRAEHPSVPVVIVTAIQDVSVAISAMRKGAYDFIIKPFEREHLLAAVQGALEQRRHLTDNVTYKQTLEDVVQARTDLLNRAIEDLERSYDITLEALGDALDLKDSETEGHSKRVTAYTIALSRAMGLESDQVKAIARGAFLHDIGKMAIPDAILRKPGPLTPAEKVIMREHCERGYNILSKIPFLAEAAEIVHAHQEFFDGRGYPRGLKGNEIPLGARIFAVADTLDAITSDRPYREARSFDVARQEILRCSGAQFDPTVVEVYVKIPTDLWTELRRELMHSTATLTMEETK